VSIDTRTLPPLATFFCLRGPRFDGHDFAETALAGGALVLVCDETGLARLPRSLRTGGATVVCVPDTEQALVALAAEARARFAGTVVGVTGSSGKTTTKEMLAAVLATAGQTLKTAGNQNNQLGVPLTLLRLTPEDRFAVIEMGTNAPGEIAALAALARPHHGIITSIGAAHLEGLGGIAGVAVEKGALLRALPSDGIAFLPADVPYPWLATRNVRARLVTLGKGPGTGLRRLGVTETSSGVRGRFRLGDGQTGTLGLRMPGAHAFDDALLALACGQALGVPVEGALAALSTVPPASMRGEQRRLPGGQTVVLDCYNANPASMEASIRAFVQVAPRGLLVLGDMLELGEDSVEAHRAIGRLVGSLPRVQLVAVGPRALALYEAALEAGLPSTRAAHAADANDAIGPVSSALRSLGRGRMLLKGSRGVGLERIYRHLAGEAGAHTAKDRENG
jgi:UDP-N-acetylmuramoyl-tripeptide--D-alanyl-D-alanine ligase